MAGISEWLTIDDVVTDTGHGAMTIDATLLVRWLQLEEPSSVRHQLQARLQGSRAWRLRVLSDSVMIIDEGDTHLLNHVGEIRVEAPGGEEPEDLNLHALKVGAVLRFLQAHLQHALEGRVTPREHQAVAFILHAAQWAIQRGGLRSQA